MANNSLDFPVWALLPKRETNVSLFLDKHPEYDGRGVKIAILDSGIDPGAKGLQKTSTGQQKIIEMMDATGAGDIDTSTVVEMTDGCITGLTGRKLKIPPSWQNPSGKFHIGIKNAYELYPKQLRERIRKARKEKHWDPFHKEWQAKISQEIQVLNASLSKLPQVPFKSRMDKEDLEAKLEILNSLEKKFCDVGPTYDCIVFHDGRQWRVAVDTSERGELEECTLLGTYSETFDFAMLTDLDRLNYCVNVHEDGNLLEIVSNSSVHGTHVASIAAAYFPDEPEKNGIAPGAQIISICIGDLRLGSMETGSALTRALIKVISSHCDVINISYGEHSHWCGGRVMELFNQVVNEHGVILVSSAGNHGPALSTIGTPPLMQTNSVIGVGAYVSPDMMIAEYSMREKKPGIGYTWTSCGPGFNGELGVSVCAPGGAITSVPNWTLRGSQLMNGTSMSSPHVAGCISILLSGLKQRSIPYSPYSIKRAIQNTALKVSTWEPFSMGHGLIQVEKAFNHLVGYWDCVERCVRFHVISDHKNGIYLRETHQISRPSVHCISVEPIFLGDISSDAERKINFCMNLKIVCDATWVSVPSTLYLMYTSRSFAIHIDPCGLSPGEHFTWIEAYDCSCVEKGPVFHFPVTVIISRKLDDTFSWNISGYNLQSEKVIREFLQVPAGATLAALRISSCDDKKCCSMVIHALQVRPQMNCKAQEYFKFLRLEPKEEYVCVFQVKEKLVLELVLMPWWNCLDSVKINYNVSFKGLIPDTSSLTMHAADGIHRVEITSSLIHEELLPVASLKSHVLVLRPSEYRINPLKARDVIPKGRQVYEIQLTYLFNIPRPTDITPTFPLLSELLYESEFESQLWMLFDSNKQFIGAGDAYPSKYSLKVEKGDYTLKLQVRHEERALLEKLSDVPMLICVKMQSSISVDIYDKHSQALINGKKINYQVVSPGTTVPLFLTPVANDKLPKNMAGGHYLLGSMTFMKDENAKKVDVYPIRYIIPELPKKASSPKRIGEKEKNVVEEFAEEVKQLKLTWIAKLSGKASKDLFEETLATEKDFQWPVLLARLQSLDKDNEKNSQCQRSDVVLAEMIHLADKILAILNSIEILASIGSKADKKELLDYKKMEQQKHCIIEALVKKGKAMCDYLLLKADVNAEIDYDKETSETSDHLDCEKMLTETESVDPSAADNVKNLSLITLDAVDEVYCELQKWCDMSDSKVSLFTEKHALVHCHYGRALKILLKQQDEKRNLDTEKKCIELYKKIDWNHCAYFYESSLLVRYPLSYRLF